MGRVHAVHLPHVTCMDASNMMMMMMRLTTLLILTHLCTCPADQTATRARVLQREQMKTTQSKHPLDICGRSVGRATLPCNQTHLLPGNVQTESLRSSRRVLRGNPHKPTNSPVSPRWVVLSRPPVWPIGPAMPGGTVALPARPASRGRETSTTRAPSSAPDQRWSPSWASSNSPSRNRVRESAARCRSGLRTVEPTRSVGRPEWLRCNCSVHNASRRRRPAARWKSGRRSSPLRRS
mmetsp:Transcript_71303/g.192025  ORF Transcript_71303/g.192025 Transcript_71303/m.192025 type:complete len:237 (+) Transcript_71303:36-746(+)